MLLLIFQTISSGKLSESYRFLDVALNFLIWLFLFCYFGDEVTSRFIEISDLTYDCPWHLYPNKLRKNFKLMMLVAQKPVYLEGIAGIKCTRIMFKKVRETVKEKPNNRSSMISVLDIELQLFVLYAPKWTKKLKIVFFGYMASHVV